MSERSSIRAEGESSKDAWDLYASGRALQAEALAKKLSSMGSTSADFILGQIYEFGENEICIDLERSVRHYRRCAIGLRDATSLRYLARALMKLGPAHYGEAFKFLQEARITTGSAEIHLALAWYYETKPEPDYRSAKANYGRAAACGRFHGFFGFSRVARIERRWMLATIVDCVRLILGVPYFIVFGKKAQRGF